MTGEVIQLMEHRDQQQPASRGTAPYVRDIGSAEFRVARITRLVMELDELTRLSGKVPATTLEQARAGLEKARRVIRPWTVAVTEQAADDREEDPQPELDDERLERMYRLLDQDV